MLGQVIKGQAHAPLIHITAQIGFPLMPPDPLLTFVAILAQADTEATLGTTHLIDDLAPIALKQVVFDILAKRPDRTDPPLAIPDPLVVAVRFTHSRDQIPPPVIIRHNFKGIVQTPPYSLLTLVFCITTQTEGLHVAHQNPLGNPCGILDKILIDQTHLGSELAHLPHELTLTANIKLYIDAHN